MSRIETFAAAVLLLSTPVTAEQATGAAVYPLAGTGVSAGQIADAQALLAAALLRQRSGALRSPEEDALELACGPAQTAPQACLGKLAGRRVVLRGLLRRAPGGRFVLELSAIDGAARAFGPVQVRLDSSFADARPLVEALEALGAAILQSAPVRQVAQAAKPAKPVAARPAVAPHPAVAPQQQAAPVVAAPVVATAPRPEVAPLVAAPAAPVVPAPAAAVETRDARPSGAWMEPTGMWLLAGGAAAAAGGAVFGYLGQKLDNQLSTRYAAHTLSPADAGSYPVVRRDAMMANALFIAGGVLAATGLVLWGLAPDLENNAVGLRGTF